MTKKDVYDIACESNDVIEELVGKASDEDLLRGAVSITVSIGYFPHAVIG